MKEIWKSGLTGGNGRSIPTHEALIVLRIIEECLYSSQVDRPFFLSARNKLYVLQGLRKSPVWGCSPSALLKLFSMNFSNDFYPFEEVQKALLKLQSWAGGVTEIHVYLCLWQCTITLRKMGYWEEALILEDVGAIKMALATLIESPQELSIPSKSVPG